MHRLVTGGVALLTVATLISPASATTSPFVRAMPTRLHVIEVTSGATAFISVVHIAGVDTSTLTSVSFTIAPKPGSFATPVHAMYSREYLTAHRDIDAGRHTVSVSVFGLYAGATNQVTLDIVMADVRTTVSTRITTRESAVADRYARHLTVTSPQASTHLDFSFLLLKAYGRHGVPLILDIDGAVRWVGSRLPGSSASVFASGAVYSAGGHGLVRMALDGTFTKVSDLSGAGFTRFHHNIDVSPNGLFLEVLDTRNDRRKVGSTIVETDSQGRILKAWDLASIIASAMRRGGDDPSTFVLNGQDWFHSNSVAYWAAERTLVVSSRENFVIGVDYDSGRIRWILGDPTKEWHTYRSLRAFALTLADDTPAPIGQHSVSITADGRLLLFDNGNPSGMHFPAGERRSYSAAREYAIDPAHMTVRQVWHFDHQESVYSPICSSVYRFGRSVLIDYATDNRTRVRLVGRDGAGHTAFEYVWHNVNAMFGWNAQPISLSNLQID